MLCALGIVLRGANSRAGRFGLGWRDLLLHFAGFFPVFERARIRWILHPTNCAIMNSEGNALRNGNRACLLANGNIFRFAQFGEYAGRHRISIIRSKICFSKMEMDGGINGANQLRNT